MENTKYILPNFYFFQKHFLKMLKKNIKIYININKTEQSKTAFLKIDLTEDLNEQILKFKKQKIKNTIMYKNLEDCRIFFFNIFKGGDDNFLFLKCGLDDDMITVHELSISLDLAKLAAYVPNFMKTISIIPNSIILNDENQKKNYNRKDVLVCEYIHYTKTLHEMLCVKNKIENQINNDIKSVLIQLIMAIFIAQQKLHFVHNDIHFNNILLKPTLDNIFILYIYNYNNEIYTSFIPSYGNIPIIIDYGLSYTKQLKFLNIGSFFDHKGYNTYSFDRNSDIKYILLNLYKYPHIPIEMKKIIYSFYQNCNINWDTGYDNLEKKSINHIIIQNILEKIKIPENIILYLISLVQLPIKKYDNISKENFDIVAYDFLENFLLFKRFVPEKYLNFLFFNLIKIIKHGLCVLDHSAENLSFESFVKIRFYKILNLFCSRETSVEDFDLKKFIYSILSISYCIENIVYKEAEKRIIKKNNLYKNVSNTFEILQKLTQFLEIYFENKIGDKVIVLNSISESSSFFIIDNYSQKILTDKSLCTKEKILKFLKHMNYDIESKKGK